MRFSRKWHRKARSVAFRSAKVACFGEILRASTVRPLNLVSSNLEIVSLPHDDRALVELRRVAERDDGTRSPSSGAERIRRKKLTWPPANFYRPRLTP